jgi:signal transduction histidine kinase
MFEKTRRQLTALNAIIFIFILLGLAFIIYTSTSKLLYRNIDRNLLHMEERMKTFDGPIHLPFNRTPFGNHDPRMSVLMWDEQHQLLNNLPPFIDSKEIKYPSKFNKLTDVTIGNFHYRSITFVRETIMGKVTLQLFRNVDSEKELLDQLLSILFFGCLVGGVLAVIAGFILAGKALIPIQKAWKKQQDFVSDASHELRTPLTVIHSRLELMLQKPDNTIEESARDISIVMGESRRLSKLVNSLLTLARSDSNQIELRITIFSLDELLYKITEQFTEIASFQGKTLSIKTDSAVFFQGDKERIHQLIVILLDNALKYTEEGGQIQLTCTQVKNHITLTVSDNGIGMEKEELSRIFDRFYQVNSSRTEVEGLGLGLSIASWIVEKHNGKMKVSSKIGEGSTFEIIFSR